MQALLIEPPRGPLEGRIKPPGSKSITNRALLLAALARPRPGTLAAVSRLSGALKSDDTARMSEALRAMGVEAAEPDDTTFIVSSRGRLLPPPAPLALGNAGTAVRFLTAAAALIDGPVVIDGDAHMRRRPIAPLVEALQKFGVDIEAPSGRPPVTVRGAGRLNGGRIDIDAGLSSQYVSALLMAAACADAPVEVALTGPDIGARGYVDLTLAAMRAFGARAEETAAGRYRVEPTGYWAADLEIEPDASAAVYVWCAERLSGGRLDIGRAASAFSQPDAAAFEVVRTFPDLPPVIDGSQMQDAVPALAVLAAFSRREVRFTGIANLRVKECDRIAALAAELHRIRPGLGREAGDDLIVSPGASPPRPAAPVLIKTYADHRIAMSFALAGILSPNIAITDPGCTAKTWPGFWTAFDQAGLKTRPL